LLLSDGVTVGHPCCAVYNCHIPLSNNHHWFCPTHTSQNNECAIIGCTLPIAGGHRTCSTPEHQRVEETHVLRRQSRFQLQERLARARAAIAEKRDANQLDAESQPDVQEEYELDESGRVLPASKPTQGDPTAQPKQKNSKQPSVVVAPTMSS
ncbi:uncharacterized protein F5147DRAFT_584426, partial [Suillus discolor]